MGWSLHALVLFTRLLTFAALLAGALGADILKTSGFTSCLENSAIQVTNLNIQYDRSTSAVTFDVAGTSAKVQNVTASLTVSAYGKQVYTKDFNPCDKDSKVDQLCPGRLYDYDANNHKPLHVLIHISSSCRRFLRQRYAASCVDLRQPNTFNSLLCTRSRWRSKDAIEGS